MKVNHVGYSAKLRLFLGVLLAACFLATAAHADSLFRGTFKLTNEVHWRHAVLAPGTYSLTVDWPARGTPIIIISIEDGHTGKIVAREFARPDNNTNADESKLLITTHGDQRAVYSVQLAGLGEVFQLASRSLRAEEPPKKHTTQKPFLLRLPRSSGAFLTRATSL